MRSKNLKTQDLLSVFNADPNTLTNYMLKKETLESQVDMLEEERKQLVEALYESEKKISQLVCINEDNGTLLPVIFRLRSINFLLTIAVLVLILALIFKVF